MAAEKEKKGVNFTARDMELLRGALQSAKTEFEVSFA
jgi:hypothetical protein